MFNQFMFLRDSCDSKFSKFQDVLMLVRLCLRADQFLSLGDSAFSLQKKSTRLI